MKLKVSLWFKRLNYRSSSKNFPHRSFLLMSPTLLKILTLRQFKIIKNKVLKPPIPIVVVVDAPIPLVVVDVVVAVVVLVLLAKFVAALDMTLSDAGTASITIHWCSTTFIRFHSSFSGTFSSPYASPTRCQCCC